MPPLCFRDRVIVVLTLCLMAAAGGWWLCERSDAIAFLPAHSGAEWIVDPAPPQILLHKAILTEAVFTRSFILKSPPASAGLSLCAFKTAGVTINGLSVERLYCTGKNWKVPATADITPLLRSGTNIITACVTNTFGPPALWLRLQAGSSSLVSDASWRVSLAGGAWQNARTASVWPLVPKGNPLYEQECMLDSLRQVWPELIAFSLTALGLIWWLNRWSRQPAKAIAGNHRPKLINSVFVLIIVARTILFVHDLPWLPQWLGFDAQAHEQYIRYIQDHGSLPLPTDGREMHQAPLYYAGSTVLLEVLGVSAGDEDSATPLRAVNGMVGLIHCWLALLCLRRLFPNDYSAQAVGLLVAAFLPPHLYLSMYVTNEPLAGLFVTLALYFCLRVLASEKENVHLYLGLGLALGAALLTKVSALLAVPLFFLAVGGRLIAQKKQSLRTWLNSLGIMLLAVAVVCGWHYVRIWVHFGHPVLGNWENNAGSDQLMYPGYRTSEYYFNFGQCLVRPLFSGFHSFGDGIYSTLWGDGMISGGGDMLVRPPWNYDLMNASYLLSLPITLLAVIGLWVAVAKFIRQPNWNWFVVIGLVAGYSLGVTYMTLHVTSYAQVKAFYGFPALVGFSAFIARGWTYFAEKNRTSRLALWVLILVWALTAYSTFWIRTDNFETHRLHAIVQLKKQLYPEALAGAAKALQLNPNDADTHSLMAEILLQLNRPAEAVQQYEAALKIKPDDADTRESLATTRREIKAAQQADAELALTLLTTQLDITNTSEIHIKIGAAQSSLGNYSEAINHYQKALGLAPDSVDALNNLAWLLATCPDASVRNGQRAVQLAERACEVAGYKITILLGTLAAAQAEAGRFDEAVATAQNACANASALQETDLLTVNQKLLALYERHRAYHEAAQPADDN